MERPRETKPRGLAEQAIGLRITALALFAALAAVLLLRSPLTTIDDGVEAIHYRLRGDLRPDTNIVIVYIDDAAVRVMGWPIRRNFHALMLSALADLKVRAVGFELMFEDPRLEYPEYDDLFARMLATQPPAILTCYFDSLATPAQTATTAAQTPPEYRYPAVDDPQQAGHGFHPPLELFRKSAAGIGHVNFGERGTVPLFIGSAGGVVPAFGVEVVRNFAGAERGGVQSDGDAASMKLNGRKFRWPMTGGALRLNYPGPLRAYTAYPFLEVLRAYDNARHDAPTSIPISRLNGKIVLIGLAAEGRGVVYDTPVDPRLPSIGMHAALVDNLLQERPLREGGLVLLAFISLLVGGICVAAILRLKRPWTTIVPLIVLLALVIVSYVSFACFSFRIPFAGPLLVVMVTITAGSLARHRAVRQKVDDLTAEKEAVLGALHDKEARLAMLERQLVDAQGAQSTAQTRELVEEIRKYKAEIRELTSRADDMEPSRAVETEGEAASFEGMIYHSSGPMQDVVAFVKKIATSGAPVLILGESGTGKELIARAIHSGSRRTQSPFVAVNCGALSETLLESELFGHEKGAFTGAVKEKLGRFELADRGTIFLDEIGEVSEGFQLKLLRVLQEGEVERVGGTKTLKVNVRVVAATNKNLKELVKAKRFRDDLYYRLNVLTVAVPPLRERREDIPLLTAHFLSREGAALRVSRNVMDALEAYQWPGNVRELESTVRRGALLAKAEQRSMFTMRDLPEELASIASTRYPVQDQVMEMIREMGFSRSAVTETAAALGGLNRGTVAEYLRGESFRVFVDQQYDLEKAVKHLSLSNDHAVNDRVKKRYLDYLGNLAEGIDTSLPWDAARKVLKSKSKNLPQRYHPYLEQCAEAFFRGVWRLP
jgi:transcriptional regulator with GAF, ATPase, and Fis domain/CHASE2 domain-containing sensor protein